MKIMVIISVVKLIISFNVVLMDKNIVFFIKIRRIVYKY